jgi:peptide/nickel transport system permease protein
MANVLVLERRALRLPSLTALDRWRHSRAWARFARNRLALASSIGLVALMLFVVVGPAFVPFEPDQGDLLHSLEGSSAAHPLGTDANGRDVLVRAMHGGRLSLMVGVLAIALSLAIGVVLGALSGYYGGWVDALLMRFTEAVLSLPTFFLVLAVLAVFPGGAAVAIVIGLTSWMALAKIVRGEFLRWKAIEFVEAAHVVGASDARIIFQHILPQALPAVIVSATLGVAHAILTESAISYLGLGIQPPTPSWGNMLLEAQQYVWSNPWLAVYPGVLILLTVICFNAIGDGLRDALDPRMGDR